MTKEVDQEEEFIPDEVQTSLKPEEYEAVLSDYLALSHIVFWKNPTKAKAYVHENTKSSNSKEGTQRLRSCFNCSSKFHFIAKFPYEPREKHAGRLVRKDKSKIPSKKHFLNKNSSHKKPAPRILLVT